MIVGYDLNLGQAYLSEWTEGMAIKHKIKVVIFPSECKGNLITLYKELYSRDEITAIKLLNKYYSRLQKESELIENNILADNYKDKYTEI